MRVSSPPPSPYKARDKQLFASFTAFDSTVTAVSLPANI